MAIYLRGKSWYDDFVHKGQRFTGCFGQVSRTVAKKDKLARKKAEVLEQKLNPVKARKSPRFEDFVEDYLEWSKANKKPRSLRTGCDFTGCSPSVLYGQYCCRTLTRG